MLDLGEDVAAALRSSGQSGRVWAVAGGGAFELALDPSGSLTFSADGEVQGAGRVTVVGVGESLVPRSYADVLSPAGNELALFRDVTVRSQTWTVPLGVFRITGSSDADETLRGGTSIATRTVILGALESAGGSLYSASSLSESTAGLYEVGSLPSAGSGLYTVGGTTTTEQYEVLLDPQTISWTVSLDVADRMRMLQQGKLVDPGSPIPGFTAYEELRRLALFPVVESPAFPDAAMPAGVVYDDRVSAVRTVCDVLGGVPHVTRDGVLTVRARDAWLSGSAVFDVEGRTFDWSDGMSDEFYNYVWAHSPNNDFSGFAILDDDSDPRSVNRAGLRTFEHPSPVYESNGAAEAGADTVLERLLNRRSRDLSVKCLPEAVLFELGDVGWFRQYRGGRLVRSVLGEVVRLEVPFDPTELVSVTVRVSEVA